MVFADPPLRALVFADCPGYRPEFVNKLVVPSLASVAINDRNATEFAQASHRALLIRAGALDPACEVCYCEPLPRSRTFYGVMIDDMLALSVVDLALRFRGSGSRDA